MKYTKRLCVLLVATVLSVPLLIAHAAGGRIEGKITDPKGAAISGATVTVTNQVTKQDFTAVTDNQGKYKVEGLPAGIYTVRVTSKGFTEGKRDEVKVEDNAAATIDVRLEIAPVEAQVKVTGQKPNQDPIYQSLRQLDDFSGNYAVVNNLQLKRDAANFNLKSGELYFITPVENRVTAAVFIGDGELTLTPPTEVEKNSIKVFTGEGGITESFNRRVLRFSDKTFEDIKANPNATMKTGGPAASQARSAFRDNRDLLKKTLRDNRELRALYDIYAPAREGCFTAFINGKRFSKLIYMIDPLGVPFATPEEVSLMSYGDSDGGIWLAFHREDELKKGAASSAEDNRLIDINRHEINATIKGTHLAATDRITFRNLQGGTRVVPFALYPTLRVSKVQDADGNDLSFIQEDKNEDADFGVIMAKPLEAGKTYTISIQYEGNEALRDSGGGNFILIPRSTWYPANANTLYAEDRAR